MSSSTVATLDGTRTTLNTEQIETLRMGLRGSVLQESDPGYDEARTLWNGMHDRRPALIVRCSGNADVIDAVKFARDNRLLLAVKGGGHSLPGHSVCDSGMLIDLSEMNGVWVDPEQRIARVQGGALLADLDRETQAFGLAAPSGNVSHTGVGGLTLGGGIGHLRRKYGLAIDNLKSVDIVTADGQFRRASQSEHPDLFWAVRGGGGSFGVVTSFEFQLHPVGPMVFGAMVAYERSEISPIIRAWREFNDSAPDEITSMIVLGCAPSLPPIPDSIQGKNGVVLVGVHCGDPDEGARDVQPLRELGTQQFDMSGPLPYRILQAVGDEFEAHAPHYYATGVMLPDLSNEVIDVLIRHTETDALPSPLAWSRVWHLGGEMGRIEPASTAFSGRNAAYMVDIMPQWNDPAESEKNIEWARAFARDLDQYSIPEYYVDLRDTGESAANGARRAYGTNYQRLTQIKTKYDPNNLFRLNQNILPEGV